MSAPLKPWERAGVNSQSPTTSFDTNMSSPVQPVSDLVRAGAPMPSSSQPPPVPPRPNQQMSAYQPYGSGYGGYSSYGSGYGSLYGGGMYGSGPYGSSMYNSYGSYGGYGGYGMNRYGMGNGGYNPNDFVRTAEESSRQAFQSIESIVGAFNSVAMMLNSTYEAVYNSFRAVLGVADHFGRMRGHLAQIFSALAVIKTLKWLFKKFLVLLRLREAGLPEDVWAEALKTGVEGLSEMEAGAGKSRSSWPIFMFFAVVFGGPWLIWKILTSVSGTRSKKEWHNGNDDHFLVQAEHDFQSDQEGELSFRRGQRIIVAPKELQPSIKGWLLACVDGKNTGIIPSNHVKVLGKRKGFNNMPKPPVPVAAPSTSMQSIPPRAPQDYDTLFNQASGTKKSSTDVAFGSLEELDESFQASAAPKVSNASSFSTNNPINSSENLQGLMNMQQTSPVNELLGADGNSTQQSAENKSASDFLDSVDSEPKETS